MTGLREEEVLGKRLLDVLPNFDRHWLDLYGQIATNGTPAHFEASFSDLQRHFEITAFRSAPGQVACVYTDITERRRRQEQSHQSAKLEAIGRLASGVAHDLNNLLMPILGYSEAALEEDVNRETFNECLREIRSAGLQAKDLVRQLLSFGRREQVDFVPVDLNAVVTGFAKLLERALRENIQLTLVKSPSQVWIRADVGQLELVLMNLAVNAQDAMPAGGVLSFEISAPLGATKASPTGLPAPAEVQLTVRDDGRGMDPESLERIFEPFFTVKSSDRGTGLGLAAVHAIVEQHGGSIAVTSKVGRGTEFVIRFPTSHEPTPTDPASAAPPSLSRSKLGESILVVEDNPLVRDLAVRALEAQGYKVRSASGAKGCLSSLSDWAVAFDLLLTDVVMPELSGKALYEILSARYPNLKVIYMSGYSREFISEQHDIARDCAFLQKPFSMRRLLAAIKQQLERVPPALR
jgi:signal transduction histidine kinase/ActR/RegA family two-component response regulator